MSTTEAEDFRIKVDSSHVWPRERRGIWRHPGCLFCLVVIAVILGDWAIWHYRERRLIHAASPIASDIGGLMGWPFGYEYRIGINRTITNEELDQLMVLNHPPRNSTVGVMFRTCDISEARLNEIRTALSECRVFVSCDENAEGVVQ